jgi:pimeloyl-ACP methyl ester carboxylesterase
MAYVTVGRENASDIDLYYEDHGSGAPVVLIHGWPLSSASWERQVPALLDAGHRVVAYDRRGFGRSSQPTVGYDYDTFAADLDVLLTRLDVRGATLVGFSMGGGEVARYVGKHGSARVAKAVFVAAIPPFLKKTADNPEGVDAGVFAGIEQGLAADRPGFLAEFLKNFFNADALGASRISEAAIRANWMVAAGASGYGTLECVSAWLTDFRADLARFTIPTLIVHGDSDRIVPLEVSGQRTHQAVKGSRLAVIKDGPHGLNWTHAAETNAALLEFLRG